MSYGWFSFHFKVLRLILINETAKMAWLYDELQQNNTSPPSLEKLRRLLHCTDFPYYLRKNASNSHAEELDDFQGKALDAYNKMLHQLDPMGKRPR